MSTRDTCLQNKTTSKSVVKGNLYNLYNLLSYSDGPALWVNETLERGQTNMSATFANELLNGGEKGKDEQYDIHNLELYILWLLFEENS